jgi:protein SCO1/2
MDLGFFKKSIPTLLFLIVFSFIGVTVFYQLMSQDKRLKIYNPIDINPRLVDI